MDLSSQDGRRRIAAAILEHRFKRPASNEETETFLLEIVEPASWEDGQEYEVSGDALGAIW